MLIIRPLVSVALVVWIAATLAFIAMRALPGDGLETQLVQSGASPETIALRRAQQGLSDPLIIQYRQFWWQAVQGNLGHSLLSGQPVTMMILQRLLPTLTLAFSALLVAVISGLFLGVIGGLELQWGLSAWARMLISLTLSTPIYWTGTLAIFFFTAQLGLFPSAGAGRLSQLILPVIVLGIHSSGAIARVVQADVRDVQSANFIRTARAKGLPESQVIWRHILRVALLPAIAVVGLQAGFLLSGTVIVESLFVRPGIGRLLLDSTLQRDFAVTQGIVIFLAVSYTILNGLADMTMRMLDPRVTV